MTRWIARTNVMKSISPHASKKFVAALAIAFVCACGVVIAITALTHKDVAIDEATFPDEVLRSYVSDRLDIDGDGRLSTEEAAKLTTMRISGVSTLSGLSAFPNLREIHDNDDQLTSADLSGCGSLKVVDFAGAENLKDLTLGKNGSLEHLYVRGTGITQLNLAGTNNLKTVECATNVQIENAPTRKVQLVDSYAVQSDLADGTSTKVTVKASYNEGGRLTERVIKGDISAEIRYEYDEFGRPVHVVVDAPGEPYANDWQIAYGDNGLDMHATGANGAHIDKTYDELGRESRLSVQATGISGELNETLRFSYGISGVLSSIEVEDYQGEKTTNSVYYNAEGRLMGLSSANDAYTFDTGYFEGLDQTPAPSTERHGTDSLTRNYGVSEDNSRQISQLAETVCDGDGNVASRNYGTFAYDDEGLIMHGNISVENGATLRCFDVSCHQGEVSSIATQQGNPSAVDFRPLMKPEISVDYWLLDTPEWLLNQELESIAFTQDVSGIPSWNSTHYNSANYNGTVDDYKAELSELAGSDAYAFVDIDGDDSVELVVSPSGSADEISAIYTLVGEKPTLCRRKGEGETLALSGNGFLVARDAGGNSSLEQFNGIGFDKVVTFSQDADAEGQIASEYLPMSGIDWQG